MAQLAAASVKGSEGCIGGYGRHNFAFQDRGLDARQQMIDALKVQLSKPRPRRTMERPHAKKLSLEVCRPAQSQDKAENLYSSGRVPLLFFGL